MKIEPTKLRFANAYRSIRLQQRARLNVSFTDGAWAHDILELMAEQPRETSHHEAAQKVFESRQYYSVAGNMLIRLAQHKLSKTLLDAIHPVDRDARKQMAGRPLGRDP